MTAVDQRVGRSHTVRRYRRLYDVAEADLAAAVAAVFTDDAELESDAVEHVVVGRLAIAEHIRSIRTATARSEIRRVTEVQWSHRTARWCWRWSGPSGSHRGMDVARLSADGDRIEVLSVYSGLLPPPAS